MAAAHFEKLLACLRFLSVLLTLFKNHRQSPKAIPTSAIILASQGGFREAMHLINLLQRRSVHLPFTVNRLQCFLEVGIQLLPELLYLPTKPRIVKLDRIHFRPNPIGLLLYTCSLLILLGSNCLDSFMRFVAQLNQFHSFETTLNIGDLGMERCK